jgi:hypothetical protein
VTVTLLQGPETTIQNTDNNVRGMDFAVYELEPDVAPLTVLMNQMGSEPAIAPKFEWLEDEAMPRITTLSASATSAATTFGVGADIFRVGDVIRFSSLGFGALISATAAGAVTATILGTQVSAQTGSEVFLVSNANAELATLRELKFSQLVTPFNYCQIIRTPFGVSTTEMGQQHYGGPERDRLSKHFGIEHSRAIEQTHFFGLRSISSVTRTAGGLQYYISTNVTNDTGGLTVGEWETFLRTGFRFGSQEKVAFCSPTAISAIEAFARTNIRVNDMANTLYGIKMSTYQTGQGTVHLVMHRDWNDSAVYGGYLFLVDLETVQERPLQNVGKTQLLRDRQAPDYDGVKDEYRSEVGLQVKHERKQALLTGVTAPSS